MPKKTMNPMPSVTYDGSTYKLRSRKIEIPNFNEMSDLAVLVWLNKNTVPKGYCKAPNPLLGMGGAITVTVK